MKSKTILFSTPINAIFLTAPSSIKESLGEKYKKEEFVVLINSISRLSEKKGEEY